MPQRKRDAAHRYFEYDESTNISSCQLCNIKLKGKHATNLKNHLSAKHFDEFKIVTNINKDVAEASTSNTIESLAPSVDKIKKLCTRLVTIHGRPLAMMEDAAFQDLVNMAASNKDASKSTNIKAIKNSVQNEAAEIRKKIAEEVKNQLVSVKLDAATCQERKFLGINIQYVKNAKIIIRNLAVLEIFERQTAEFLKATMEEILTDFQISVDQIYCICTDNGSNMIKMVKILGGQYYSDDEAEVHIMGNEDVENEDDDGVELQNDLNDMNEIFEDFDIENIRWNDSYKPRGMLCAAHTLQLAVKDAINECIVAQTTINMARRIVHILRKPNNLNLLKEASLKKPVKDCPTRWSSTYNMLERLLTFEDFSNSNAEIALLLSNFFWNEVRELLMTLTPANKATILLQKEQFTVGDFYITWLNCKNEVKVLNSNFAAVLLQCMEQRQIKLMQNDLILEGLYLDGRLNVLLSAEQCQKARSLLKGVFQQIQQIKKSHEPETQTIDPIDQQMVVSNESSTSRLSDLEEMLRNTERMRALRPCRSFDMCLFEVLSTPRLPLTEDILMHWHNKSFSTSELAMVAKVVLAAPTTQVSVERLFSSLKFILSPLRSNLSCYSLRDIMIIRENKDL